MIRSSSSLCVICNVLRKKVQQKKQDKTKIQEYNRDISHTFINFNHHLFIIVIYLTKKKIETKIIKMDEHRRKSF